MTYLPKGAVKLLSEDSVNFVAAKFTVFFRSFLFPKNFYFFCFFRSL